MHMQQNFHLLFLQNRFFQRKDKSEAGKDPVTLTQTIILARQEQNKDAKNYFSVSSNSLSATLTASSTKAENVQFFPSIAFSTSSIKLSGNRIHLFVVDETTGNLNLAMHCTSHIIRYAKSILHSQEENSIAFVMQNALLFSSNHYIIMCITH